MCPATVVTTIALMILIAPSSFSAWSLLIVLACTVASPLLADSSVTTWFCAAEAVVALAYAVMGRLLSDGARAFLSGDGVIRATGFLRVVLFVASGCTALAIVFRDANVAYLITSALLLFVLACALPRRPGAGQRKMAIMNGSLFCVSTVVSILLLEGMLRVLNPGQANFGQLYEPHRGYVYTLRPNSTRSQVVPISNDESFEVEMVISKQGFRDREFGPKEDDEFRILMLGDSFTMGLTVPLDETFVKGLEGLLGAEELPGRVTVINSGIPGSGPLQQLGLLRKAGLALEPDLVVLQVYSGNDAANSLEAEGRHFRSYDVGWMEMLNIYRSWDTPVWRIEHWAQDHLRLYQGFRDVFGRKAWIGNLVLATRFVEPVIIPDQPPTLDRPHWLESNLRGWYPDLERGFSLMKSHILEIKGECDDRRIPFLAFNMPDALEVSQKDWDKAAEAYGGDQMYEHRKIYNMTLQFFRDEAIPHFEVLNFMDGQSSVGDVYYMLDGHPTPLGNRLLAERLRDYLVNDYGLADEIRAAIESRSDG
jgi:lysophospholipase L1-like esterase